jgi:phosphopantetheinyl transferase
VIRVESPIQISESCRLWIGSIDELPTSFPDDVLRVPDFHLLSPDEQGRLEQYRVPQKKWQFFLSRLFVKEVLTRHFGTDAVRMEALPGGQPILCGESLAERCSVSLSHSAGLFAMVIGAEGTTVGVDIEAAERLNATALHSLFQLSCSNGSDQLSDCRHADQLRLEWTGREALWKALGGPQGYTVLQMPVVANSTGLSFCGDHFGDLRALAGLFGFQSGVQTLVQSVIPINVPSALEQSFCGCVVELRRIGSHRLGNVAAPG